MCLFILLFTQKLSLHAQGLIPEKISTYATGIFDEGAAEIVAHDPVTQRLFVVNGDAKAIDAIDINDPSNPTLAFSIDITPYGDGVNSVDVANGTVAVAIEAENTQDNGVIGLFDTDGNFLAEVPAGALPDGLTFSPDGNTLVCANEGEPNDDYTVDPEGSITIVDLKSGATAATVTQVTFEAYNDRKASLMNRGIRIFGNNGNQTVAQDLEPEYVAFSEDGSQAFVSLQENNALAILDMETNELVDIVALGYKDHFKGAPVLHEAYLNRISGWPDLGIPLYGGEAVKLGGFSGLWFSEQESSADYYVFYCVPDRGPNASPVARADAGTSQNLRPFKLPDYQGRIVKFGYKPSSGEVYFNTADQILLKQKDGVTPISGKGNIPGFDEVPVTQVDNSVYTRTDYTVNGVSYQELPYDPFGGDFEGIVRTDNGEFWMCDEYRPAIYHFSSSGTLIERYVPDGTSMLGDNPQPAGTYGAETLPAVYSKRRANRGFEALALDSDEGILYAFIQSPMYNPGSSTRNNSDVIRILGIDPATGTPVREYVYLLERNRDPGVGISRVDKIGDAVYVGNGRFLVLERDSSTPDDGNKGKKFVFEFSIEGATNILNMPISSKSTSTGATDKTLEMMTADEIVAMGIQPVHKVKVLNLPSIGYLPSDKPEGLALLPGGAIAVMNDNDFGLAGAGVSDNSVLGIINFQANYTFDASNRTDDIRMWQRPTLGMYQPDAISSYTIDEEVYIVSANEGDARDYDGYSEEERVKDLELDPKAFPNYSYLQTDESLGRLNSTTANGDIDGDGLYEYIYSYGARSFSIWDAQGNLVWDSGDQFERILAQTAGNVFNSTNDDNDSRKNRSDDKGPEPEAIEIAKVGNQYYALIGLERQGGIMIYDITDPYHPVFERYINNRNFDVDAESTDAGDLGPEEIIYISESDSPNGNALIAVANEVSGTTTLYGVANDADRYTLQILHNNDGESALINAGEGLENIGGVAAFKTVADSLRYLGYLKDANSVLLSSGDNFLPGPEFTASSQSPEYYDALAVKYLNYDALALGNHDFDFGPEILAQFINQTAYPLPKFLSSNLDFSGEPALQSLVQNGKIAPSTVLWRNGEQIGVIGLTTPNLPLISSPRNVAVSDDIITAVQNEVSALQAKGINKIILISHLQSISEELELAEKLNGIDVIIAGGGDELLTNTPDIAIDGQEVYGEYPLQATDASGNTVYLVTTPGEYRYIGNLIVHFNENGEVVRIDEESDAVLVKTERPDPFLTNIITNPVQNFVDGLDAKVVATTEVDLDGLRGSVRTMETNEGNLIADALLWQANQLAADFSVPNADVALQNGGGIRNNTIIAGGSNISELTTFSMLPFSNFVSIMEAVPATQFKEILENAVSQVENVSGRFAQVAGFEFIYDPSGTPQELDGDGNVLSAGSRIVEVTLANGTKIVENGNVVAGAPSISIATIDFLARGGDNYPYRGTDFTNVGVSYQQALRNYLGQAIGGRVTAAQYPEGGEGRIRTVEDAASANLSPIAYKSTDTNFVPGPAAMPNPFIDQFTLSYALAAEAAVDIRLMDANGKMVADLYNGIQAEGTHMLHVNDIVKAVPSGLYFIEIQMGEEQSVLSLTKR